MSTLFLSQTAFPKAPQLLTHAGLLGLKWRSDGAASEDFKTYIALNRSGELLATSASIDQVDNRLDIWETATKQLFATHEIDTSSSACFCWLSDNRYFTGSNDTMIRLWSESHCEAVLTGHSDWIRSLAACSSDEMLLSGGMDGEIGLWDVQQLRRISSLKVTGKGPMNAVQGITFAKDENEFFGVMREGEICGFDLRSFRSLFPPVTATQVPAHSAKTNSVQVGTCGRRVLTSGRDSAARLWDLRTLRYPLQTFDKHKCKMFPIAAKFLYGERCVITGSEDCAAYIYDAVTGEVVRKIEAATHVTQTEPVDPCDLSFYAILYQNQRLAFFDVHGEDIPPEIPSAESRQRERVKVAMQEVLWELNNQIFQHLRVIGRFNMVGYGNLLEALQDTAATNAGSRSLLQEVSTTQISVRYERKLSQWYIPLPPLPALSPTASPQRLHLPAAPPPRVHSVRSRPGRLLPFVPQ